jgi:hypothetical protein
MNNLNTIPADPKLIEAVVLACLEKNPIDFQKVDEDEVERVVAAIKRATTPKGAALKYTVTRKNFLCGCLDFTEKLPEEHLIVGYGFRRGNTTDIERIHHVAGEGRRVAVPDHVRSEIRRHHFHRSDAEVIVFHNHPRTGNGPEWFYTLKSLIQDLPVASTADRSELQHHAFNAVGLFRQFFGQGQVLFYFGESGFVKAFQLPPLLPFLEQLSRLNSQQQRGAKP